MGGVRAGTHCGIRMRETVHTGAGLGAESREHFTGLFMFSEFDWDKMSKELLIFSRYDFHIKSHASTPLALC